MRTTLVALALLVCAATCWLAFSRVERGAPAFAGGESESPAAPSVASELAEPELVPAPTGESEDANATNRSAAPDERPRIAGHVRVAGGLPAGEKARVVAEVHVGRENDSRPLYERADVARDGSFVLRVPNGARYAMLDVEGALLHLAEPLKALPGDERVVLEPELLAQIHGRVLPPLGVVEEDLGSVQLSCKGQGDAGESPQSLAHSLLVTRSYSGAFEMRPAADGAFEFSQLPVGVELELEAKNPWGPDWSARVEALLAGERRELVIALETGITLTGRVLDEHGAPVPGATIHAMAAEGARTWRGSSKANTDEGGGFEFTGLARRDWKLSVYGTERTSEAEALVDGTAGDVRALVLTVVRGSCIEGTVAWPDGRPVEGFSVLAHAGGAYQHGMFEDGRFEQCALADGAYTVDVSAESDGIHGEAHLEGVHAGERDLRIVLDAQQVFEVRGSVVDAEQHPVLAFRTEVTQAGDTSYHSHEGGSFILSGLTAGECQIEVQADESMSATQTVVVGPHATPLRFVLPVAGRIRGTVLDARGQPVANAAVGREDEFDSRDGKRNRTDASGRFDVAATSAPVRLQATCEGHAASDVLELSVASGASVDGVILRLREACRLEGRVLDADGHPVGGANLFVRAGGMADHTESDARGHFAFEALAPGSAEVFASLRDGGSFARATAVLGGGRTTTIELRFERPDPVRLRGRIVRGGKPFAGSLWLMSKSRTANVQTQSGNDGRFEATLTRPGEWECAVVLSAAGMELTPADVRVLDFVVPDVEEHALELDVDAMRGIESLDELGY